MNKKSKIILSILISISSLQLSSCVLAVGAVAGATGYAYIKGSFSKNLSNTLNDSYHSALETTDELDYKLINKKLNLEKASIVVKTLDDTNVSIYFEYLTENATKVTIDYGIFGDKEKSKILMDRIIDNL